MILLTQHVFRHGGTENVTGELAERVLGVNSRCTLEHLHHGLGAADFQHLVRSFKGFELLHVLQVPIM